MTQQASDNGTGVSIAPASPSPSTLEERSAAAFDIRHPSESADESPDSPPAAAGSPADSAGAVDTAAAERAARRAKYEEFAAAERQRVDAQARHREADDLRKRLDEAERRAEAAKNYVDPSKLDEAAFFEMASKLNVTPQKLGTWLQQRMTDPDIAAAQSVSRVVDPKLTAMEQRLADQQKTIDGFLAAQQAQQQQAEERHYVEQFHAFTRENAPTSPYASRFLEVHGPDEYAKIATAAAQRVPAGAGAQAILDEVEERLTQLASIYAPQNGAPQQRPASLPQITAAAKAPTTVSNTLAQTRASVVDEDQEWSSLPFEERSARLFR